MANDGVKDPATFPEVRQTGVKGPGSGSDYEIGFRKPPQAKRFKKGKSGNPKGRPKAKPVSDITPVIETIFAESIKIREGESSRQVSKLEAILRAQLKRALMGDPRAIKAIFNRAEKCGLLSKSQQKSFFERTEPEGEDGQLIKVYHAERANWGLPINYEDDR